MPCTSGRANHILLKKDCPSGCNCCVNTAYSCEPIQCLSELTNVKKPNIAKSIFLQLKALNEESDLCSLFASCFLNLSVGSSILGTGLLQIPSTHCEVTIVINNLTSNCNAGSVTFEDLIVSDVITNTSTTCPITIGDTLEIIIDGIHSFQCVAENNVS